MAFVFSSFNLFLSFITAVIILDTFAYIFNILVIELIIPGVIYGFNIFTFKMFAFNVVVFGVELILHDSQQMMCDSCISPIRKYYDQLYGKAASSDSNCQCVTFY